MLASLLRRQIGRVNPLGDVTITITAGAVNDPGVGGPADQRHYGYSAEYGIGSRSPTTMSGYTISEVRETIALSSTNGAYTSPIVLRTMVLKLTGGAIPLVRSDISQVQPPLGGLYTDGQATFVGAADGGEWTWTLPDGTDDGSPDKITNGDMVVTA